MKHKRVYMQNTNITNYFIQIDLQIHLHILMGAIVFCFFFILNYCISGVFFFFLLHYKYLKCLQVVTVFHQLARGYKLSRLDQSVICIQVLVLLSIQFTRFQLFFTCFIEYFFIDFVFINT